MSILLSPDEVHEAIKNGRRRAVGMFINVSHLQRSDPQKFEQEYFSIHVTGIHLLATEGMNMIYNSDVSVETVMTYLTSQLREELSELLNTPVIDSPHFKEPLPGIH